MKMVKGPCLIAPNAHYFSGMDTDNVDPETWSAMGPPEVRHGNRPGNSGFVSKLKLTRGSGIGASDLTGVLSIWPRLTNTKRRLSGGRTY